MKVTSKKSISFPKLNWGISAGEVKELPEDEKSQERILLEPEISIFDESQKINNNNK